MEYRKAMRRVPLRDEALSRIRLRTGREMSVVDVSNTGVLVEGHVRLLPGTHVDVHVVTRDGRVLVRSRVVRCWIAALDAASVWYRGALAFDRHLDTAAPGYAIPQPAHALADAEGPDYPLSSRVESAATAERLCA
jgi:hypothetical protein